MNALKNIGQIVLHIAVLGILIFFVGIALRKNDGKKLEIYTSENIYYVDQSALTVNAETWDHELRFKTANELQIFIAEQTATDAAINE